MYTEINFKTKKALKEAVKAGQVIGVYSPGLGSGCTEGKVCIEGPHYPAPHAWYASAEIKDGKIVKVS